MLEFLVVLFGLLTVVGGQDGDREQFVGAAAVGVHMDHGLYDSRTGTTTGGGRFYEFQIIERVVFDLGAVLKVLELREDQQEVSLMIAI